VFFWVNAATGAGRSPQPWLVATRRLGRRGPRVAPVSSIWSGALLAVWRADGAATGARLGVSIDTRLAPGACSEAPERARMDTAIFLNGGRRVLPGTHVPPQAPMRHRFWASSGALCTDLLSVVCRSDRPSGGVVSSEHRGFLSRTRAPRAGGGIDWVATLTEPWAFSASSRGRWGAELAISGGLGNLPRHRIATPRSGRRPRVHEGGSRNPGMHSEVLPGVLGVGSVRFSGAVVYRSDRPSARGGIQPTPHGASLSKVPRWILLL
jgi:hypothetical protein